MPSGSLPGERARLWALRLLPVAVALVVVLAALLWYPPLWQRGYAPVNPAPYVDTDGGLLNINTAGAEALTLLPGIGPAKAEAIVAYRAAHGPFSSGEELLEVKGIGPKTLHDIEGLITW